MCSSDLPADRFPFAIRVGGENDAVGLLRDLGDLAQALGRLGVDLPGHGEVVVGQDRTILRRQVADVTVGGQDRVVRTEVLVDGLGLCRAFDDDEIHRGRRLSEGRERGWRKPRCQSGGEQTGLKGRHSAWQKCRTAGQAELQQGCGDGADGRIRGTGQFVTRGGDRGEQGGDSLDQGVVQGVGCAVERIVGWRLAHRPRPTELAFNVVQPLAQDGALPQKFVRPPGARIQRRAGHGEDVAALFGGQPGGDQRAGADFGLHHDHAALITDS